MPWLFRWTASPTPDSGRGDGAGGEHNFAPGLERFSALQQYAGCAAALEQNLVHAPSGHDHEIGAPFGVAQERFRRRSATPFMGCGLVEADALLLRSVEVLVVGQSRLLRGADECPGQRMTISP